jgi:hypothetical protein
MWNERKDLNVSKLSWFLIVDKAISKNYECSKEAKGFVFLKVMYHLVSNMIGYILQTMNCSNLKEAILKK